jgi:hypothetical protein
LEVDGEGRDLLGETKEVDGGVEEGGLELSVEVDDASAGKGEERKKTDQLRGLG